MKNKAFTLAEILITLRIIGVVAALTIPSLINNHQERALLTKIRKSASEFSNAFALTMAQEGMTDFYSTSIFNDTDGLDKFMNSHFKVLKTCGREGGCFSDGQYKSVYGDTKQSFTCNRAFVLTNGVAVCPTIVNIMGGTSRTANLRLQIDTNGPKKPNTGGKDMFMLTFDDNGKIAINNKDLQLKYCPYAPFGANCYEHLLKNNFTNMDYERVEELEKQPDVDDLVNLKR